VHAILKHTTAIFAYASRHSRVAVAYRSLRQLRKEVATKLAQTAAAKAESAPVGPPPVPAGLYESQSDTDMSPGPYKGSYTEFVEVTLYTQAAKAVAHRMLLYIL